MRGVIGRRLLITYQLSYLNVIKLEWVSTLLLLNTGSNPVVTTKMKIMKWKKFIPGWINIRSLYWVEYEKSMDTELSEIFQHIDDDNYVVAKNLIQKFEEKHSQGEVPMWVAEKMASIYKAKMMLSFLTE